MCNDYIPFASILWYPRNSHQSKLLFYGFPPILTLYPLPLSLLPMSCQLLTVSVSLCRLSWRRWRVVTRSSRWREQCCKCWTCWRRCLCRRCWVSVHARPASTLISPTSCSTYSSASTTAPTRTHRRRYSVSGFECAFFLWFEWIFQLYYKYRWIDIRVMNLEL